MDDKSDELSVTPSVPHNYPLRKPPKSSKFTRLKNEKGLKICHQNINSIRNKFEDVLDIIIDCKPDIYGLTESKLDSNRDHNGMYLINGYNLLRFDRLHNKGGGTIIYVKSELMFDIIDCPVKIYDNSEFNVIRIRLNSQKQIIIVYVYSHPSTKVEKLVNFFSELNVFLCSLKAEYYILGDFNCDLLKKDSSSFSLFSTAKEYGLWQFMSGPTFKGQSLLDHAYASQRINVSFFGHFPFTSSDHDFTFIVRKVNKPKFVPQFSNYRCFKNCDFDVISNEISKFKFNKFNETNSNDELSRYNSFLFSVLDKFAPNKRRLVKAKHNPWYTSELAKLRKDRDKLRKLADKSKLEKDVKLYRVSRNIYNTNLTDAKKTFFKTKFVDNAKDSYSLWQTVNSLTGYKIKPKLCISKLEDPVSNVIVTDQREISLLLAKQFVVKSENSITTPELIKKIDLYSESYDYSIESCDKINVDEVVQAIKSTKRDSFSNLYVPLEFIKRCQIIIAKQLAILFTLFLTTCSVPKCFNVTTITPILKGKGLRTKPSSYRPISCINIYCKLFERILFYRLRNRIESKLCKEQHGFRAKRSCQTAIDIFTNDLYSFLDKPNGKVIAIYYDAKSAFDSLDRSLLINKLMVQYKLHPNYIRTLFNYMSNRLFNLKGDDVYYENDTGIVQGASIGPLLYGAYQNDICEIVKLPFLLYADDLCVYLGGTNLDDMFSVLKNQAEDIQKWYEKNNMKINYEKTKLQIFHKPKDPISDKYNNMSLVLNNNNVISQVKVFRYLGVDFDSNLSFNSHFDNVSKKVSNNIGYLNGFRRYLTDNVMTTMVNCYVHSIIDYSLEFWAVLPDNKLKTLQSKIDNFIVNFHFPKFLSQTRFKCKSRKRVTLNVNDLRDKCNFLTVIERRDLNLLKYAFKYLQNIKSDSATRRSWPLLIVPSFRTKIAQCSNKFRAVKLWNSLPKTWDGNLQYFEFVRMCREFLLKKRSEIFMYY